MEITLFQAFLIGVFCWLASIENCQPFGILFSSTLAKPLVGGAIVGLILGDVKTGVIIGAAVQAMYLGNVLIGGVATADMTFVAYPSIALAMLAGADAEVAITLAATIGVLGAALFTAYEVLCSVFYQAGDKAIADRNYKRMRLIYTVFPPILSFAIRFTITFVIVLLGSNYASGLLAAIPDMVLRIMGVLGGILPAVGISILLTYSMKDFKFIVFFFIGILCVTFMGFNMVATAVAGSCLAVMYYMFTYHQGQEIQDDGEEELL